MALNRYLGSLTAPRGRGSPLRLSFAGRRLAFPLQLVQWGRMCLSPPSHAVGVTPEFSCSGAGGVG